MSSKPVLGVGRAMAELQRGLRVILFSDVVDSTGRMFDDETTTVQLIQRDLAVFRDRIASCGGELIKTTGDGILATFATTDQALGCIQSSLDALCQQRAPHLQHRFGLHIGEIYQIGSDVAGSGVNVAARLQTISPANGVAFTQGTYASLDSRFRHLARPHGLRQLKGIPERVRCYALHQEALLGASDLDSDGRLSSGFRWLRRRLHGSTPVQAVAAVTLLLAALVFDLVPANPISVTLLDRRLRIQKGWRGLTAQQGPQREPLPVLLLESREPLYPRAQLATLLETLPPQRFPSLALDLVLDQVGPDPAATRQLIEVIRRQRRQALFVGYFGSLSAASDAGLRSRPIEGLQLPGVQPRDLAIGTAAGDGILNPPPLQLLRAITPDHFAAAIATGGAAAMPADAVIDWSLPWERMVRVVFSPSELSGSFQHPVLVGRVWLSNPSDPDLFRTPLAFFDPQPLWRGSAQEMPGVLLQAVVAQSLSLRHWLMPLSSLVCVALASGAGVLLAALQSSLRRRLQLLLILVPSFALLALQVAVGSRTLIPIALPSVAFGTTALLRRD